MQEKSYLRHLTSSADLETTHEAVRAGFVALALEKNRQATPFVEQARALKAAVSSVKSPYDLASIESLRPALLAAAGVSDKAAKQLTEEDRREAIRGLVVNFLDPAGKDFAEELVFRFLLTRGDTLGGSMRNIGGALAQRKLLRALISSMHLSGRAVFGLHASVNAWVEVTEADVDIENVLRGLAWENMSGGRVLLFNLNVPVVGNNIDLCLIHDSCHNVVVKSGGIKQSWEPSAYLALGELKGGIDPAGADEHWKTAGSALDRVRRSFNAEGCSPDIFFIGAAIAKKMAEEIWQDLQGGLLTNAANLTDYKQANSLCIRV
jgi:hypothetical protein